jgi:hypothetical protein
MRGKRVTGRHLQSSGLFVLASRWRVKSGRESHFDVCVCLEDEWSGVGISVRRSCCCTKALYEGKGKGRELGEGLSFMSREQGVKLPEEGTSPALSQFVRPGSSAVNSNSNPLLCNTLWIINKEDGPAAAI